MRSLLLAVLACAVACRPSHESTDPLDELQRAQAAHDEQLAHAEGEVDDLSERWSEVVADYSTARASYEAARSEYVSASARFKQNSQEFEDARRAWAQAEKQWQIFGQLVQVAAMIDAANLDSYRHFRSSPRTDGEPFSCASVSTASYRRYLVSIGISVIGMDVDHIVPKSLGGADHPANYQLLTSGKNRSIGNMWNAEKCLMAGARCADAVAVSLECGTYREALPFW